jgi:hypothetical protein
VQPLLQLEEPEVLLQRRETAEQQDYYRDEDHGSVNEEEEEETNTTGRPQNHVCRNSRVLLMLTVSVITTWHNTWPLTGNITEGIVLN